MAGKQRTTFERATTKSLLAEMELSHSVNQNAELSGVNRMNAWHGKSQEKYRYRGMKKCETRTGGPWGPT